MYHLPTSVELNTATYEIPPGTSHPEFVVPLEVTDFIIEQYGLANPRKRVIDPFAGNGDFIRRIIRKGGRCDGIELDPAQHEMALDQMPYLMPDQFPVVGGRYVPGGEIELGDCTKVNAPFMYPGYHAIYTSWPFALVRELARPNPKHRDLKFAEALNFMLVPDGGLLIIDSADYAERDGQTLTPSADTVDYLVNPRGSYGEGYFNLVTSHRFSVKNPPPGCDGQFTELVFTKRWPYYPGALAGLAVLETVRRG